MRRYANRNLDMMNYAGEPASFNPPKMPSQLDPKDERLLELSAEVGNLTGQNDLLAEDNGRLEHDNQMLKEKNKKLLDRNLELENEVAANQVEKALKERKK